MSKLFCSFILNIDSFYIHVFESDQILTEEDKKKNYKENMVEIECKLMKIHDFILKLIKWKKQKYKR